MAIASYVDDQNEEVERANKYTAEDNSSAFDDQVAGSHYKSMAIQPIEFILANNITYTEGAIIKYVSRWKTKNGIEDLKKAKHFLEMLIEYEQGKLDVRSDIPPGG